MDNFIRIIMIICFPIACITFPVHAYKVINGIETGWSIFFAICNLVVLHGGYKYYWNWLKNWLDT